MDQEEEEEYFRERHKGLKNEYIAVEKRLNSIKSSHKDEYSELERYFRYGKDDLRMIDNANASRDSKRKAISDLEKKISDALDGLKDIENREKLGDESNKKTSGSSSKEYVIAKGGNKELRVRQVDTRRAEGARRAAETRRRGINPSTDVPKEVKKEIKEEKREEKKEERREEREAGVLSKALGGLGGHKSKIFWIGALIFLIFIIWFVADVIMGAVRTPFGQLVSDTLNQYLALDEIKKTVGTDLCIVGCYAGNLANVGTWTAAGGLGNYCQSNCVTTAKAEELGCTNCYSLTATVEDTKPIPTSDDTVTLTIDSTEGKKYAWSVGGTNVVIPIPPALNPIITLSGDTEFKINEGYLCTEGGSTNDTCHIITPGSTDIPSMSVSDIPLKMSADFKVPCQTTTQYTAYFSYDYGAVGISHLKFKAKDYKGTVETPTQTASPGPLKFNTEPYNDIYTVAQSGGANEARVTFSLVNSGKSGSNIQVNSIIINQTTPAGDYGALTLKPDSCIEVVADDKDENGKCLVADDKDENGKCLGGGVFRLKGTPTIAQGDENAVNFHCSFTIPDNLKQNLKQAVSYTLIATANYTYTQKVTGDAIFTDTRYRCYIAGSGWKMENDQSLNEQGDPWTKYDFNDLNWQSVSFPDSNWGCENCDRFYRSPPFVYDVTRDHIWLNISSDDGAKCWWSARNTDGSISVPVEIFDDLAATHTFGGGPCRNGDNYCEDLQTKFPSDTKGNIKNYVVSCAVKNGLDGSGFKVTSDK